MQNGSSGPNKPSDSILSLFVYSWSKYYLAVFSKRWVTLLTSANDDIIKCPNTLHILVHIDLLM